MGKNVPGLPNTTATNTLVRSESRGRAVQPKLLPVDADDLDPSDDEMTKTNTLEKRLKEMSIDPMHPRFFGKSSSVMFLQTAMALKHTYAGNEGPPAGSEGPRKIVPCKRPEYWRAHSVSLLQEECALSLLTVSPQCSGSWNLWRTPSRTHIQAFHLKTSCPTLLTVISSA